MLLHTFLTGTPRKIGQDDRGGHHIASGVVSFANRKHQQPLTPTTSYFTLLLQVDEVAPRSFWSH